MDQGFSLSSSTSYLKPALPEKSTKSTTDSSPALQRWADVDLTNRVRENGRLNTEDPISSRLISRPFHGLGPQLTVYPALKCRAIFTSPLRGLSGNVLFGQSLLKPWIRTSPLDSPAKITVKSRATSLLVLLFLLLQTALVVGQGTQGEARTRAGLWNAARSCEGPPGHRDTQKGCDQEELTY